MTNSDKRVRGVLTGQVPVDSMPISMNPATPDEDTDEPDEPDA